MSAFARSSSIFPLTPSTFERRNTKKQSQSNGNQQKQIKSTAAIVTVTKKRQQQPPSSCISFQVPARINPTARTSSLLNGVTNSVTNGSGVQQHSNGHQNNNSLLSQLTMSQLSDAGTIARRSFVTNANANANANATGSTAIDSTGKGNRVNRASGNGNGNGRIRAQHQSQQSLSQSQLQSQPLLFNKSHSNQVNQKQKQKQNQTWKQQVKPASAYAGNIFFSQTQTSIDTRTRKSNDKSHNSNRNGTRNASASATATATASATASASASASTSRNIHAASRKRSQPYNSTATTANMKAPPGSSKKANQNVNARSTATAASATANRNRIGNRANIRTNANANIANFISQTTHKSRVNAQLHAQVQAHAQYSQDDFHDSISDEPMQEFTQALKSQPLLPIPVNDRNDNNSNSNNNRKRSWMETCMDVITTPYRKRNKPKTPDTPDPAPAPAPAPAAMTTSIAGDVNGHAPADANADVDLHAHTVPSSSTRANPITALTNKVLTSFQTPSRKRSYDTTALTVNGPRTGPLTSSTNVNTTETAVVAHNSTDMELVPVPPSSESQALSHSHSPSKESNIKTTLAATCTSTSASPTRQQLQLLQHISSEKQYIQTILQQITQQVETQQSVQRELQQLLQHSQESTANFHKLLPNAKVQQESLQHVIDSALLRSKELDSKLSTGLTEIQTRGLQQVQTIVDKGTEVQLKFQEHLDGRVEDTKKTVEDAKRNALGSIMETLRSMVDGAKEEVKGNIALVARREVDNWKTMQGNMTKEMQVKMEEIQRQAEVRLLSVHGRQGKEAGAETDIAANIDIGADQQMEQDVKTTTLQHVNMRVETERRQTCTTVTPKATIDAVAVEGTKVAIADTISGNGDGAVTDTKRPATDIENAIGTRNGNGNGIPKPSPTSLPKAKASVDVKRALKDLTNAKEENANVRDKRVGQNKKSGNRVAKSAKAESAEDGVAAAARLHVRSRRKVKKNIEFQRKGPAAPIDVFELPSAADREKIDLNISPLSSSKSVTRSDTEDIVTNPVSIVNEAIQQEPHDVAVQSRACAADSRRKSNVRYNLRSKRVSPAALARTTQHSTDSDQNKPSARIEIQKESLVPMSDDTTQLRSKRPVQRGQRRRGNPSLLDTSQNPSKNTKKSKTQSNIDNMQAQVQTQAQVRVPNAPDDCTPPTLIRKELGSAPPTAAPKLRRRRKQTYQGSRTSSSSHQNRVTTKRNMLGNLRLSNLQISDFDARMRSPPSAELLDGMNELTELTSVPVLPLLDGRRRVQHSLDMRSNDVFEFA